MKRIYCDVCGKPMEYGAETAVTDGKHIHKTTMEIHTVWVQIKVNMDVGRDICSKCRWDAILSLNPHAKEPRQLG